MTKEEEIDEYYGGTLKGSTVVANKRRMSDFGIKAVSNTMPMNLAGFSSARNPSTSTSTSSNAVYSSSATLDEAIVVDKGPTMATFPVKAEALIQSGIVMPKGRSDKDYHTIKGDDVSLKVKNYLPQNIYPNGFTITDAAEGISTLDNFPYYSIKDFIDIRESWRRQPNPFGTVGFFYFKIFFNFNTNYGLLGGVKHVGFNNGSVPLANINTAYGYLNNLAGIYDDPSDRNNVVNLYDRLICLKKFVDGLAYVSENSPWFFKGVEGLNAIRGSYIDGDDFNDDKTISIVCSEESVDMRLGTLFDLYKFVIYDNINSKEIIPRNLRRFDMSILFFNTPIKYYQTEFKDILGRRFKDKEIDFKDTDNIMSFKMFTFMNCEFDQHSLNEFKQSVSNESPFNLGNNLIKINYDRVIEHRVNEFEKLGFGSDKILINDSEMNTARLSAIADDILRRMNLPYHTDVVFPGENLYGNFTNVRSKYYLDKLNFYKNGAIEGGNIYNYDYGRVGNGVYRRNTAYLDRKLDNIRLGTINRKTEDIELNENLAEQNFYKLNWGAQTLHNSNNMYAVEGIQTRQNTWLGRLAEATWQRTKHSFGF